MCPAATRAEAEVISLAKIKLSIFWALLLLYVTLSLTCWGLLQQWKRTSFRLESSRPYWYSSILVSMPQIPPLTHSWLQWPYSPHSMPGPSSSGLLLQRNLMLFMVVSSPNRPRWGSTRIWKEVSTPRGQYWGWDQSPKLDRRAGNTWEGSGRGKKKKKWEKIQDMSWKHWRDVKTFQHLNT